MVLRSGKRKHQDPLITSQQRKKKTKKEIKLGNPTAGAAILHPVTATPQPISATSQPTSGDKTCTICVTDKPPGDYPAAEELPVACRKHCLEICRACIRESLAADIANKPPNRIGCPDCAESWEHWMIKRHASPADFVSYEWLTLRTTLEAMPQYRACLRPDCKGGQIHGMGEAEPIVICNECGSKSCYTHKIPWHAGKTCKEYDRPEETDMETKARLAAEQEATKKGAPGVKLCPRCQIPIEKSGGCDHIRCQCPKASFISSRC